MKNYTKKDVKSCNDSRNNEHDIEFIKLSATYRIDDCQGTVFEIWSRKGFEILEKRFMHIPVSCIVRTDMFSILV